MNRSEAIELMVSRAHITREQAEKALTALLEGIDHILKRNGGATLAEFEAGVADGSEASEVEEQGDVLVESPYKGKPGSWDSIRQLSGCIEGPPDWAENHDHYLRLARTASYGEEE